MLLLKVGREYVCHRAASHGRHAGVHFRWCDGNCADAACTTFGSAVTGGGGARRGLVGWHCVEADSRRSSVCRLVAIKQTRDEPEAVAHHVTQAPLAYQPGTGRPCRVE